MKGGVANVKKFALARSRRRQRRGHLHDVRFGHVFVPQPIGGAAGLGPECGGPVLSGLPSLTFWYSLVSESVFMADLIVRKLLIDMAQPIARHWCDGDAFRSAFFNALSMSFPIGEQFFIDAVRGGFAALPEAQQARLRTEVQGFIGQEATHRRLHALYNGHLETLGLVNAWEQRARQRFKLMEGVDMRHWLGITAANEHFTAVFADWMLNNPDWLGSTDERLKTLWLWHSAVESEHRSTAFDLYRALGGNEEWRLRWFRRVTLVFIGDVLRQTVANLRRDGTLWRLGTWTRAAKFLFSQRGLVRCTFAEWRAYLRADFHPRAQDDSAARRWLEQNQSKFRPVGA
jgi:predicted metal-dependent hydrolase